VVFRISLTRAVFLAIILALICFCSVTFEIVVVPTPSMERTVMVGDHLLINRFAFRWRHVQPGDVISFRPPKRRGDTYLKRVIAVGGDVVEIRDGMIFVNGSTLAEPYAQHLCRICRQRSMPLRVPEGELYVLGDNRDRSEDSRLP
jgi:signal peptidase I